MTPLFLPPHKKASAESRSQLESKRYHPWMSMVAGGGAAVIAFGLWRVLSVLGWQAPLPQGLVHAVLYGLILYGVARMFTGATPSLLSRSRRFRQWAQHAASPSDDSSGGRS